MDSNTFSMVYRALLVEYRRAILNKDDPHREKNLSAALTALEALYPNEALKFRATAS